MVDQFVLSEQPSVVNLARPYGDGSRPPVGPGPAPADCGRIPRFPAFKCLDLGDRPIVEAWVRRFPPSSDFNFVSLWSWNVDDSVALSWLNDNLVVRFKAYDAATHFYSFLGETRIAETAATLLDRAHREGLPPVLSLIPESVVARVRGFDRRLTIAPEEEQFDHIVSTEAWSTMAGGSFRKKRNAVHHLERTRAPRAVRLDLRRSDARTAILGLLDRWIAQRGIAGEDEATVQTAALRRVFALDRLDELICPGVVVDGELAAYAINEVLTDGYAIGHYRHADRTISGLYPYLMRATCRELLARGCRYLNIEQDLGIPGLAHAKQLERPTHHLRKFAISAPAAVAIAAD